MDKVGYGIIGSGFIADLHAHALRVVPEANLVAVASPTPGKAKRFAEERGIPHAYSDYRELLARKDIQLVSLALPNDLHAEAAIAAARAGKHVVCEKPLCRTLAEADRMIAACKEAGVHLFYAEELLFAPKYVRAKKLVEEGAIGKPFLVKQGEEHDGPHMPWFWDVERSGGGVLLDMGCHSIEFGRWILGKPPVQSVYAQMGTYVHGDKTRGEDHSLVIIEFEGGGLVLAENSWAKRGGVDDRCEIYGTEGFTRADLLKGSALLTYSQKGYGYAVEKAGDTRGYTFTMFEEVWNYGFPQELGHFCRVVQGKEQPLETGEDGREVLKIMYAAYQSAGEGRKILWPYTPPPDVRKPIDSVEAGMTANGEAVYIGLDLGGTKVYGAVVGADGSVHAESYREHLGPGGVPSTELPAGTPEERALGPAYPCLVETAARLIEQARAAGQRPVGIGVGAPGLTRPDGVVVLAGTLAWRDVPLGALLARRLGLPVRVENDVNLAALGEHAVGAGKGTGSMFLIAVGTGIGGAVVLDGKLWRGRHFAAGEIGALLPGREYLSWDNREVGALETYAAGAGFVAEAQRLAAASGTPIPAEEGRGERLFAQAAAGVPWAKQVIDRGVDLWTVALSAVQSILDPDVIVLSGGVADSAAVYLPEIVRRLERSLPCLSPIVLSKLGYRASVLGVPTLFE